MGLEVFKVIQTGSSTNVTNITGMFSPQTAWNLWQLTIDRHSCDNRCLCKYSRSAHRCWTSSKKDSICHVNQQALWDVLLAFLFFPDHPTQVPCMITILNHQGRMWVCASERRVHALHMDWKEMKLKNGAHSTQCILCELSTVCVVMHCVARGAVQLWKLQRQGLQWKKKGLDEIRVTELIILKRKQMIGTFTPVHWRIWQRENTSRSH